jgi:hypothetical protein
VLFYHYYLVAGGVAAGLATCLAMLFDDDAFCRCGPGLFADNADGGALAADFDGFDDSSASLASMIGKDESVIAGLIF